MNQPGSIVLHTLYHRCLMWLSYQPTLTLLLFPPFVPHTGHQLRLSWFRNDTPQFSIPTKTLPNPRPFSLDLPSSTPPHCGRMELRTGGTKGEDHRYRQAQFTGKRDEEKINSNNFNNKRYKKKLFTQQTCFSLHTFSWFQHRYKNANSFLMLLFPCRSLFTLRKIYLFLYTLKQWNK